MTKPILCLDFDGVIHSYTSGWEGPTIIPDPPVPGAVAFIKAAIEVFRVSIFSSRSHQPGGLAAMQDWLKHQMIIDWGEPTIPATELRRVLELIDWPLNKPPATVSLDDRALTFDGDWPDLEELANFKPWNRKD